MIDSTNNMAVYKKETQKKAKITPKMVLSYTSATIFYYLTFQFNKAKELDVQYKKKIEEEKSYQEVEEVSNDEILKNQKRIEKYKKSSERIEKLKEFVKYAKDTIYEQQIVDILDVTTQIHRKYVNDEDLNIYKLEQFHTYHTDPFIKLIDEAFSDIKNIKIPIVYAEPITKSKPSVNMYNGNTGIDIKPINFGVEHINWDVTMSDYDIDPNAPFHIKNKSIFDLAQQKLLSLRDTLVITPATNEERIETILNTYKSMHFFKQSIYDEMSNEQYIYIGKITERGKLLYFCFINKKQDKLVQYNVLTDFPRVLKLNK